MPSLPPHTCSTAPKTGRRAGSFRRWVSWPACAGALAAPVQRLHTNRGGACVGAGSVRVRGVLAGHAGSAGNRTTRRACRRGAPWHGPGLPRSSATLLSTLLPSVIENSIRESVGKPVPPPPAAAAPAAPPLPALPAGGTRTVWCLPTSRLSCRPGRGLAACAAALAFPEAVCLKRTMTTPAGHENARNRAFKQSSVRLTKQRQSSGKSVPGLMLRSSLLQWLTTSSSCGGCTMAADAAARQQTAGGQARETECDGSHDDTHVGHCRQLRRPAAKASFLHTASLAAACGCALTCKEELQGAAPAAAARGKTPAPHVAEPQRTCSPLLRAEHCLQSHWGALHPVPAFCLLDKCRAPCRVGLGISQTGM